MLKLIEKESCVKMRRLKKAVSVILAISILVSTFNFVGMFGSAEYVYSETKIDNISAISEYGSANTAGKKSQSILLYFDKDTSFAYMPYIASNEGYLHALQDISLVSYTDADLAKISSLSLRDSILDYITIDGKTIRQKINDEPEGSMGRNNSITANYEGSGFNSKVLGLYFNNEGLNLFDLNQNHTLEIGIGLKTPLFTNTVRAQKFIYLHELSCWLTETDANKYLANLSNDGQMQFKTADSSFNAFINEFYKRHLRVDSTYAVGATPLGSGTMFAKEWEAQSSLWFDSTKNALKKDDSKERIRTYLDTIDVDKFGNAYVANYSLLNGTEAGYDKPTQGWPFPTYTDSGGKSRGWEFNTDATDFSQIDTWTIGSSGTKTGNSNSGFLNVNFNGSADQSFSMQTSLGKKVGTWPFQTTEYVDSFHAPFLEMDIRLKDNNGFADSTALQDIYVSWQTTAGGSTWYSVPVSTWSTVERAMNYAYTARMYMPMYLNSNWNGKTIKTLKIEVRPKTGASLANVDIKINYIRLNYDSRQSNNSSIYISALSEYIGATNDLEMLKDNLPRARKAMNFLLETLNGKNGMIDLAYFVGKDALHTVGHGIGNGYWDILPTGRWNMDANLYFYKALRDMAYLEQMAIDAGITVTNLPMTNGTNNGTLTYSQTPSSLRTIMNTVKTNMQKDYTSGGFWIPTKGRFAWALRADNTPFDYGFIDTNEEAITEGIATASQESQIMSWITGERIISGENSTGADIYNFKFAPRTTTIQSTEFYWQFVSPGFGQQVQDGGAILFTSYYDLMARIKTKGVDNAFSRFKEIQSWYEEVKAAGGTGTNFYRNYYAQKGITMQGPNTGAVGIDAEFLESALVYATIPLGFLGLDQNQLNTVSFSPQVPIALQYIGIDNMMYAGIKYNLEATNKSLKISGVTGNTTGKNVKVTLNKTYEKFAVKIDGVETTNYVDNGTTVTVTAPFQSTNIEVVQAVAKMTQITVNSTSIELTFDKDITDTYEAISGDNGVILAVESGVAPKVTGVQWAPSGNTKKLLLLTNAEFTSFANRKIIMPSNFSHAHGAVVSEANAVSYIEYASVWQEKPTTNTANVTYITEHGVSNGTNGLIAIVVFDTDVGNALSTSDSQYCNTISATLGNVTQNATYIQWNPGTGANTAILFFPTSVFSDTENMTITFKPGFMLPNGVKLKSMDRTVNLSYEGKDSSWQQKTFTETTSVNYITEHGISGSVNGLVAIIVFDTDVGSPYNTSDPQYCNAVTATLGSVTLNATYIQFNAGTGQNTAILFFPTSVFSDSQNMTITFKPGFMLPNGVKLATKNRIEDLNYEGLDSSWQIKANTSVNRIIAIAKVNPGNNSNYLYVAWFENPLIPEGAKLLGSNYIANDKLTVNDKNFTVQWGEIWSNSVFLFLDHLQSGDGALTKLEISDEGIFKVLSNAKTPTGQLIPQCSFVKGVNVENWNAGLQFGFLRASNDNMITNLYQNITLGDILNQLSSYSGITFKNKLGIVVTNNAVKLGTGSTLEVNSNGYVNSYTLLLKGDVDGDSEISISDLVAVKQHLLKTNELTGVYKSAGDIYNQGKLSISSLLAIKKQILGISSILQ